MPADLVSLDELKSYLRLSAVSEYDETLTALIGSVSETIRRYTAFDWDTRVYTERRNGNGQPAMLALRAGTPGPSIASVQSVKENGITLTTVTAYSETAAVIVDLAEGVFYRRPGTPSSAGLAVSPGRWAPGVLNVEFAYTTDYAVANIPGDLKVVARYAAALLWKQTDSDQVGISNRNAPQGSVGLLEEMPKMYRDMLDRRRRVMQPAV